ncbi:hypothetical protein BIW11_05502 [Tropilaelaps mercedesae]|uniref:Uncharacterized protein n=1 Tax=Tropilaelaps mercedesae TaxID=418985 RepID=A0A1V9Y234_9ACAR|nr:hypothetical protein BIW11_05502 [Tropilaelaps mercedesae]
MLEVENQNQLYELSSETVFSAEMSRLKEAEVLMASLEEYVLRRFGPRPSACIGKGVFQLKLDEVRSKVYTLENQPYDEELAWACEKITLLVNLCRNVEAAIRCAAGGATTSAAEGIALCNDADQVMDCLRLELRKRSENLDVLSPISHRLAKVKAHYLAQLTDDWRQQVRWQKSEFPRSQQLIISSEGANTFQLLRVLRNPAQLAADLLAGFLENFVKPLSTDRSSLNIIERSSSTLIELTTAENRSDNNIKVDPAHNLQTAYSFLSGILLPLLGLQEDSREVGAVFDLLAKRARREPPATLNELATSLHGDLPQAAALLNHYAIEADASKEALQIMSEMEEMMVTALEPVETAEIANLPRNLSRSYLVSSWVPSLTESILRLSQECILLPVFSRLFRHFSSMESEALSNPRKAAIFLNNCIYMANRCCLHSAISSSHILILKEKGTSLFLRYVNEHKAPEVAVSLPVPSALKAFISYIDSLAYIESSWKQSLLFDNYSRATGLLFNTLSVGLESYVFQQKFLTEFELGLLRSLVMRAISTAEAWCRESEKPLQVSSVRLTYLLRLLQMSSEDIVLAWRSRVKPLSGVFTAQQVLSLAKARFALEEFDKLQATIV